nr:MAG TPA: hypothetical protein [Bacteriophage sp.]
MLCQAFSLKTPCFVNYLLDTLYNLPIGEYYIIKEIHTVKRNTAFYPILR